MSIFDDLLKKLEYYDTKEDKLEVILDGLFEENNVSQDKSKEKIPVLIGTAGQLNNSSWRRVDTILSAWGTPIDLNPYDDYRRFFTSISTRKNPNIREGDRLVFVAECGDLQNPTRVIGIGAEGFALFKDLGLKNDADPKTILNRILYGTYSTKFGKYRQEIRELLSEKNEIEEIKSELEVLKEDYQEYLDFKRTYIPNGLDHLREEYNSLNAEKAQLTEQVSELKKERDEFDKVAGQLALIQKQLKKVVPMGKTADDVINALNRYDEQKNEIERAKKQADWLLEEKSDTENLAPVSQKDMCSINFLKDRLKYEYSDDILIPVLSAMATDQLLILYGKPGTGKTSFVQNFSDAIGAKCTMISVQNNWTDKSDILGYFNPITGSFMSTPFLEALLNAWYEYKEKCIDHDSECRLHIICLDEMNLARIEYYFAEFLHLLQLNNEARMVHVLPPYVERQVEALFNNKSEIELESQKLTEEEKKLKLLQRYLPFRLPPNVRFVGTINNDDTTNNLSPKVIDRSIFVEMTNADFSESRKIDELKDFYPAAFFKIDKMIKPDENISDVFKDENGRFKNYLSQMYTFYRERLALHDDNQFISYLILAKILPSISKAEDFTKSPYYSDEYPMVRRKFDQFNVTSGYFNYLWGAR